MDSIVSDVNEAAHNWVDHLTVKEEKYTGGKNAHERIGRTLLQMKFEGEMTAQIEYIGKLWNDLLETVKSNDAGKDEFITKLLLLFEAGGVSRIFVNQLLTILCNDI